MSLNADIAYEIGAGMILKNNDATRTTGFECLVQEIKIESVTARGDLWYDSEYGWGLQDFIHRNIDDMTKLEIYHRVKTKMFRRNEVEKDSLKVSVEEKPDDTMCVHVRFAAYGEEYEFALSLDRVNAEVKTIG